MKPFSCTIFHFSHTQHLSFMDRRQFTLASLAALADPLFADGVPNKLIASKANDALLNFPKAEEIPEVAHIERIMTDAAHKALIIYRQIHVTKEMDNHEARIVEKSQWELYRVLGLLLDKKTPGLDHIMCEEYINDPISRFKFSQKLGFQDNMWNVFGHEPRKFKGGLIPRVNPEFEKALRTPINRIDQVSILARYGAGEVLAFTREDEIEMLPGADIEVEKKTDAAITSGDEKQRLLWVFEKREQALLSLVANSRLLVSYALFGADHRWTQRIHDWNSDPDHAEQKLSALIVSTNAVKEFRE